MTNSRKETNRKILKWVTLGFAAFIFTAVIIAVSQNKFYAKNFCLMNSDEKMCSFVDTNCFTEPNGSVFTSDFGFGKFLVIDSAIKSNLGTGTKICIGYLKKK